MDLGLKGKRAVVTGGSRGIGRAIALRLAEEGCDVALCARGEAGVREAVAAVEALGVRCVGTAVDLTDTIAAARFVDEAAAALGAIDLYVSNVSAMNSNRDIDAWRASSELDILSTVAGIDAAVPHLGEGGSIVFIGSTAAVEAAGGPRPYAAVKAAVIAYVKALARELAPKGRRVNTVSPGNVFFEGGVWDQRRINQPDAYQRALRGNPMGRMGRPEEVADAVAFIGSPRAGFISGVNLIVDGAATMRIQY